VFIGIMLTNKVLRASLLIQHLMSRLAMLQVLSMTQPLLMVKLLLQLVQELGREVKPSIPLKVNWIAACMIYDPLTMKKHGDLLNSL